MSGVSAPGSPAPNRLRGILRSWLHAWSSEFGPLPEDQPHAARGPAAHDCGPVHVLVADDNPVNLMLISALMESRGMVPLLASDGAEAVALACALRFDLILMDIQMPVLDGLGATAAIRRFETASSRPAVPVLAYSSACPDAHVLAAHGISGRLDKPCSDQDLEACLLRWCPTYRPAPTCGAFPTPPVSRATPSLFGMR